MKNKFVIAAAALLMSFSAFAQKDEIKGMKKIAEMQTPATKEDMQKFKGFVAAAEPKIGGATPEQQADFYYYKSTGILKDMMVNQAAMADLQQAFRTVSTAVDDLNKVIEIEKAGKKKHTDAIKNAVLPQVKSVVGIMAGQLTQQKMYKEAASLYALAYKADPNDKAQLYNAAAMAVNGQDYDNALNYYLELDKSGFTGAGTSYTAKNKETGEIEAFPNQLTRDASVKAGQHTNPKDEKLPSLKGEITKNIALIYIQKGDNDKARQAIAAARKSNPNDVSLIVAEANIYYKLKDMEAFKRLTAEAAAKNPNNPELFYNLGVVSAESDPAEAERQYLKALEVDPNYEPAMVALASQIISGEQKIVEEMNSLGTSKKDNDRYDVLKKKRDDLYHRALPYLEKAHKLKPDDEYTISLLAGIYQALERDAEYKAMKAKMKG